MKLNKDLEWFLREMQGANPELNKAYNYPDAVEAQKIFWRLKEILFTLDGKTQKILGELLTETIREYAEWRNDRGYY